MCKRFFLHTNLLFDAGNKTLKNDKPNHSIHILDACGTRYLRFIYAKQLSNHKIRLGYIYIIFIKNTLEGQIEKFKFSSIELHQNLFLYRYMNMLLILILLFSYARYSILTKMCLLKISRYIEFTI